MSVNDKMYKELERYEGSSLNERVYNYLGSLGYTGSIDDRLNRLIVNGNRGWKALSEKSDKGLLVQEVTFEKGIDNVEVVTPGETEIVVNDDNTITLEATQEDIPEVWVDSQAVVEDTVEVEVVVEAGEPECLVCLNNGNEYPMEDNGSGEAVATVPLEETSLIGITIDPNLNTTVTIGPIKIRLRR